MLKAREGELPIFYKNWIKWLDALKYLRHHGTSFHKQIILHKQKGLYLQKGKK